MTPASSQTSSGSTVWRSLEEARGDAPAVPAAPSIDASGYIAGIDRREFMGRLGASLALAGVASSFTGCIGQPPEQIVPYSKMPEYGVSGDAVFFATAMSFSGRTIGLLAESHNGRPTKIEGNQLHPASLGATDAVAQAAVLGLYDPERSQTVRKLGEIATWEAYLLDLRNALQELKPGGAGLRILTQSVVSPTLARQLRELAQQYPESRRHQYDPTHADEAFRAQQRAFGRSVTPVYRFKQAKIVVSLDADFLASVDGSVRYARDFMDGRNLTDGATTMNRLYVAESSATGTGGAADHRLPLKPTQIVELARELGRRVGGQGGAPASPWLGEGKVGAWLNAVAADLEANRGASVVIAGDRMPWQVHWLAYSLNQQLGNVGQTVVYTDPVEDVPADHVASLTQLCKDIEAGQVDILLIVGGNPAFDAPADLDFAKQLVKVKRLSAHWSTHFDETSQLCNWHIAATHFLEQWGDVKAYDGTASIVQPLIAPLYRGKTEYEFLSAATGRAVESTYDIVRATWQPGRDNFETFWRTSVHDGLVAESAAKPISVTATPVAADVWNEADVRSGDAQALEAVFAPDPTIWDGRFAGNGWLQELPKTWTRLTWTNAVLIGPKSAQDLGLESNDVVEVTLGSRTVTGAVWVAPGIAEGSVTLHYGYGRRSGAKIADGRGFDVYPLRTAAAMSIGRGLTLKKTGGKQALPCTQHHHNMEGRDIVRSYHLNTIAERLKAPPKQTSMSNGRAYFSDPNNVLNVVSVAAVAPAEMAQSHDGAEHEKGHAQHHASMYPDWKYEGAAWGMVVDASRCLDCGACVTACQAENNIPVVGPEGVEKGREMHWLRLDRYFAGSEEDPQLLLQPSACQHCEHAPCEVVCPVAATTHSNEGLNEMTYNRCVGTRYCSNNCPYKARRFNFLEYAVYDSPLAALVANPDVTVRSRGVMEKCTYCVQRINYARIEASKEAAATGKPMKIADGAVVTACQAACSSQAIVFGDLNDPNSRVSKLKNDPRNYGVLEELGTRPRTTYLSHVTNPHPSLTGAVVQVGPQADTPADEDAHEAAH